MSYRNVIVLQIQYVNFRYILVGKYCISYVLGEYILNHEDGLFFSFMVSLYRNELFN